MVRTKNSPRPAFRLPFDIGRADFRARPAAKMSIGTMKRIPPPIPRPAPPPAAVQAPVAPVELPPPAPIPIAQPVASVPITVVPEASPLAKMQEIGEPYKLLIVAAAAAIVGLYFLSR
mgnify:CR=1